MLVFSFIRSRLVLAGFPESSLQRRTYESPQKESRIVDETSDLAATKHITTHNMVLKIRLARFGKRHAPFYNIVVAHARYAYTLRAKAPTTAHAHLSTSSPSHTLPPRKETESEKRKGKNTSLTRSANLQNRSRQQTSRSPRHIRPHPENTHRQQRDGEEVQGYQARH